MLRRLHILAQRNDARDRHRSRRRVDFALVIFDDGDAVEENRLHRGLPGPEAQRIIAQRRIIGVENKGRTAIGMPRSEEHTSELQSLMRISYAVLCLKQNKNKYHTEH